MKRPIDEETAAANLQHGKIVTHALYSGFSFAQLLHEVKSILKSGRWRLVGAGFSDVNLFLRTIDMSAHKITIEDRAELAAIIKKLQPKASNRAIAAAAGVDESTIREDLRAGNPAAGSKKSGKLLAASAGNPAAGPTGQAAGKVAAKALIVGESRAAKEEDRQQKRTENQELVANAPDPAKLESIYSTIVIDPPWDWGDEGDADQLGRARPTYTTMSFDELRAFPAVRAAAAPDSHLYLWITNRSLPKGSALMEAWGFRYVTCLTWCKPGIGMGNYFRGSTEHVLFGVRGSLPLSRKDIGTWFSADRPSGAEAKHSAKPDDFYKLIETCSPGPYLDIFARKQRPGWVCYGAEVE